MDHNSPQSLITNLQSLILFAILLIAAGLRFYRLDASSLWSDEGNTWALLSRSFIQIAQAAAADIHPPGYYWLLKIWTAFPGHTATAMRSFSAVTGVLLVWLTYHLTLLICTSISNPIPHSAFRIPHLTALLAAFLAAINPFQVYYSQEARMYILLALESAGLFWAMLALIKKNRIGMGIPMIGFVLCGIAGLWTHYSFPIVLAAADVAYLYFIIERGARSGGQQSAIRKLILFTLLNMIIVLTFLPWLPIALDRVRNWPKGGEDIGLLPALGLTMQTLTFGPLRNLPTPLWPWLLLAAILPLLGLYALRCSIGGVPLALWLLAPILLMLGLGLYSDAFLKFLLIASPAWCIATAATCKTRRQGDKETARQEQGARGKEQGINLQSAISNLQSPISNLQSPIIALAAVVLAWQTLPTYYADPAARDNYAGVARYIQNVGDPVHDLVVLDAPGQQEVWRYYDPGFALLALPEYRPPDPNQTLAALALAVADRRQVFALFWATDEADPERIVERWLDQHAFKGLESWQGNLRFVTYSLPNQLQCQPIEPAPSFGQQMTLNEQCQPEFPQRVPSGAVALIGLRWQALTEIDQRYKISIQLLDARNQVIAQHDSEPGGGSQSTDHWLAGVQVADNHGLLIPFGTPPGEYRLVVVVYDPGSGQRLPTIDGDFVDLGQVQVTRTQRTIPLDVIPIQHRLDRQLGVLTLIGYAAYRKGYVHEPSTPVQAGDLVHFTLYWQAPELLPPNWPDDQFFVLQLGNQTLDAPLAGGAYPTGQWQAGEVVRAEFDLPYDGSAHTPTIQIDEQRLRLRPLPR